LAQFGHIYISNLSILHAQLTNTNLHSHFDRYYHSGLHHGYELNLLHSQLPPENRFYFPPEFGLRLPNATANALCEEIPSPADLFCLTSEDIVSIKSNLGKTVYDDGVASRTFKLPLRATNRLTSLAKMMNYLSISIVRRDIRWENIRWDYVTTFNDEYKALEDLAEASPGEVPKYKAIHGMVTHIYAIDTYLKSTYGANKCPLRYLTMSNDLLVD